MKNEVMDVMDVEVKKNEDNEVLDEIVPAAKEFDETSEPNFSTKDMVIGGTILGLAAAGTVAIGCWLFKGINAVIGKIKDKAAKKNKVIAPATEEINEKPVEVVMSTTDDVEVMDETE